MTIKRVNISTKITTLVLTISVLAVLAISFFTYEFNLQTNREKIISNLNVITENRASQVNTYFDKIDFELGLLQRASEITNVASDTGTTESDPFAAMFDMGGGETEAPAEESADAGSPLEQYLATQKDNFKFEQIYVTSNTGAIKASTDSENKQGNFSDPDGTSFENGLKAIHYSSVFKDKDKYYMFALAPITGAGELLIVKLNLNDLYKSLQNSDGLGQSGEIILGRQDPLSKKIILASPLRGDANAAIKLFDGSDQAVSAFKKALDGKEGSEIATDYRGKQALQVWKKLSHPGWALVGKIDKVEADGQAGNLTKIFIYAGLCIVALATLLCTTHWRR